MARETPIGQCFMGLTLLLGGVALSVDALQTSPGRDERDVTVARPLRPREARPPEPASTDSAKLGLGLLLAAGGVGMGLFGLSNLREQGALLRDGVPTVGWITRVEHSPKSLGRLTFRFEDDQGLEREGTYATFFAEDEYVVGQEVTVVYDGADSSKYTLDRNQVRRAEAETRRL